MSNTDVCRGSETCEVLEPHIHGPKCDPYCEDCGGEY